jgi:hypothetical protein
LVAVVTEEAELCKIEEEIPRGRGDEGTRGRQADGKKDRILT